CRVVVPLGFLRAARVPLEHNFPVLACADPVKRRMVRLSSSVSLALCLLPVVHAARGRRVASGPKLLHELSQAGQIHLSADKNNDCTATDSVSVQLKTAPFSVKLRTTLPGGPLDEGKSFVHSFSSAVRVEERKKSGTIDLHLQGPFDANTEATLRKTLEPIEGVVVSNVTSVLSVTPTANNVTMVSL
ncbi:hypothetical protein FOZ63_023068, partial [Perkinsus olseni]